jgi:hypothetical protein
MPHRIFASLLVAGTVALVFGNTPPAGPRRSSAKSELLVLTAADASFQIKYPQNLVRCEDLDGENPDVWSPQNTCAAAIPVCDSSGHAGNVLACLAYPKTEFHGSELQAAAFAISRLDIFPAAKECLRRWPSRDTSDIHTERIRGMRLQSARVVETQGSYVAEHLMYRAFHRNACYEMDVNISIAMDSAFAVEDAPRKLTAAEREKINTGLKQALEGFRFLK